MHAYVTFADLSALLLDLIPLGFLGVFLAVLAALLVYDGVASALHSLSTFLDARSARRLSRKTGLVLSDDGFLESTKCNPSSKS